MMESVAIAETASSLPVEVGGKLVDAQLLGLSVPSSKVSAYFGRPLVINVWASWCGPCRAEMASLERLSRRVATKQVNVIGISTDDYRERASAFLKASHTSFPNFIDHDLIMENMLGADRLPLTLLVDPSGRVIAKFYGANEWDSSDALRILTKAFHIKM